MTYVEVEGIWSVCEGGAWHEKWEGGKGMAEWNSGRALIRYVRTVTERTVLRGD
jgi:hypothetical protein